MESSNIYKNMEGIRNRWPILKRVSGLCAVTVIIPTLTATIYYGLIASDLYISESTFVIRNIEKTPSSLGLVGAVLQTTGLSSSNNENAYAVTDYMISRDALAAINRGNTFFDAYGPGQGDYLSRFHTFFTHPTFEDLFRYFKRRISVYFDSDTGITDLQVEGFTALDARKFNEQLLELAEKRVNEMNIRAAQDTIRVAQSEVDRAEEGVRRAAKAVAAFRQNHSVFDPERQSELQLQQSAQLQNQLIANQALLEQVQLISPANPQILALKSKIATLETSIANLSPNGSPKQNSSLSVKSADYERLALDREFADRQLTSAMASLESARADAMRQQLYIERISQPNEPDKALRPRRIRNILITFVLGLIVWGCLALLIASVREHHD